MTHKQKILKYLDFKGITQGKFCIKCGFSNSFLASGSYFGTDKLTIIVKNYKDLNINWLLFDDEEMLLYSDNTAKKTSKVYGLNYKDKYIDVLEENRELNKKMNLLRESNER